MRKFKPALLNPQIPAGRDTTRNIPSLNEWVKGPVASKPVLEYTGDKMLGIATMHKSNAVPVFCDEQAVAISNMRR